MVKLFKLSVKHLLLPSWPLEFCVSNSVRRFESPSSNVGVLSNEMDNTLRLRDDNPSNVSLSRGDKHRPLVDRAKR